MSAILILAFATATQTFSLPVGLLSGLCFVESSHKPAAVHKDDGGQDSVGLCQMHMSTAKLMGYKGSEKGLLDPSINAHYAAKYLKHQIDRYNGDLRKGVSAYNAGSYRTSNKNYVVKVFKCWARNK